MAIKNVFKGSLSLPQLLAIVIICSVSVWNFIISFTSVSLKNQKQIDYQRSKIEYVYSNIFKSLEKNDLSQALDLIENAQSLSYFDFYILKKNDQLIAHSSNIKNLSSNNIKDGEFHQPIDVQNRTYYVSKKTVGSYEFVAGYFPINIFFTWSNIQTILKANLLDFVVFFSAVVLFGMNGFIKQTKLIFAGKREDIENFNPNTIEGKLLKNLFLHASDLVKKEAARNIPSGIENEIALGSHPGTIFDGVIIRIDMNDYTPLCRQFGVMTIDSLLSPIFSEFREICQRYSFYEVADGGDERVYYGRVHDPEDGAKRVVGAIRGMFAVGKRIQPEYLEKFNIPMYFKASFSLGKLAFRLEDNCYKIRGDAYTNSARYIKTFDERANKNYVIATSSEYVNFSKNLFQDYSEETYNLKGIGQQILVFVSDLKEGPIEITDAKYFLSNNDITNHLSSLLINWNEASFWTYYKSIKTLRCRLFDPQHKDLLKSLTAKIKDNTVASSTVLPSLLMMFPKLVPTNELNDDLKSFLESFVSSSNSRLQANAIESLGDLGIYFEEAKQFLFNPNNRIRANAIVIVGKKEIFGDVMKSLKELLRSEDEIGVASGLYATDRLFAYYESEDSTTFKTARFFYEIYSIVNDIAKNKEFKNNERAQSIVTSYQYLIEQ